MQDVFQLVTIYKYAILQYIGLTVQITISYHEIKTFFLKLFLIQLITALLKLTFTDKITLLSKQIQ